MIPVIEIFGATIQGEGSMIGAKTMFIRTGGCDYSCSWCDSKFTWDGTEKPKMMEPQEILNELHKQAEGNFEYITISGGNPALIGSSMQNLLDLLHTHNYKIALETQGSRWQEWFSDIDILTLSPKPPSSGMKTNYGILTNIISKVSEQKINLKIVIFDDNDYDYAIEIHKKYPEIQMYLQVGNEDVQGEANSVELLNKLSWLFDKVISDSNMNKVRVLPQLHTLIWGNKRGV